jgi:hypothetical protein
MTFFQYVDDRNFEKVFELLCFYERESHERSDVAMGYVNPWVVLYCVGLGWVGLGWVGLGWVGLGWVEEVMGWVGLGWVTEFGPMAMSMCAIIRALLFITLGRPDSVRMVSALKYFIMDIYLLLAIKSDFAYS